MDRSYKYVVFFDLDKTIIRINSGELLVRQAYREGLMSTVDILKGIYFSILYKFGLRETDDIIADMAMWIAGLDEKTILKLARNIFNTYLIGTIRPEIVEAIAYHRKNDAEVVILSASIPELCEQFANHLQIENILCSELETVDGKFTGQSVGNFCFGDEKRIRLEDYCQNNNYDLKNVYCYADAISDLSALAAVGHPVCVNPDKQLAKKAEEQGWQVYKW